MLLAFLSGLTLTVIPATATDAFSVVTTFRDRTGRTIASTTREESVTTWIQLLLVFLWPFMDPDTVMDEAIYDLAASSLVDYAAR